MITFRILAYIVTLLSALFFPWWVFVCVAVVYAFIFSPFEILIIAVCIDVVFGDMTRGFWNTYFYCMMAFIVVTLSLYIKPTLSAYR